MERQNSTAGGVLSRPLSTVDPVVVRPEADSKKPSQKVWHTPVVHRGTAPSTDSITQASETIRNPSRWLSWYSTWPPRRFMTSPSAMTIRLAITKCSAWPVP